MSSGISGGIAGGSRSGMPGHGSAQPAATIRAGALSGIEPLLLARGVTPRALCERSGVDPAVLAQPERRIAWSRYLDLLDRAAALTGDRAFGMHLGYQQCVATLGRVGDMAWSAGTLAEAVTTVSRSMFLHQDQASLSLRIEDGLAIVSYRCGETGAEAAQQDVELSLAKMLRFARQAAGTAAPAPALVRFRHRGGDVEAARRLFGAPVLYGQSENALAFPRALLAVPLLGMQAGERPSAPDFVDAVRDVIMDLMARGLLSATAVATRLGVSERGLQRRLQARGLAFSGLVETARRLLAERLLLDPRFSMGEISELLGYSEQSAFSRAFRRWTRISPQQWRLQRGPSRGSDVVG